MPIIRYNLYTFTRQWNGHKINKRKGRDYVYYGIPKVLYRLLDPTKAIYYRVLVDKPTLDKLATKVERDIVNAERYLPEEVIKLY